MDMYDKYTLIATDFLNFEIPNSHQKWNTNDFTCLFLFIFYGLSICLNLMCLESLNLGFIFT